MTFKKFISFGSAPASADFPNLGEYLIWMRVLVATCYGLSLGIRGYEGGMGLVLGGSLVYFIPLSYVESVLKAKMSTYEGLHLKGFFNGLAWLLLIWITLYSMKNAQVVDNMDQIASSIAALKADSLSDEKDSTSGSTNTPTTPGLSQAEF